MELRPVLTFKDRELKSQKGKLRQVIKRKLRGLEKIKMPVYPIG